MTNVNWAKIQFYRFFSCLYPQLKPINPTTQFPIFTQDKSQKQPKQTKVQVHKSVSSKNRKSKNIGNTVGVEIEF